MLQGKAEATLIAAQPERFPPSVLKYVKEGYREWRSGHSGKPLIETIKAHLRDFDEDVKGMGADGTKTLGLLEISVQREPSATRAAASTRAVPSKAKVHPLSIQSTTSGSLA